MKIKNALNNASEVLKDKKILSYTLDSEILLSKILRKDRKFLILNPNFELSKINYREFLNLIEKRSMFTPIAYLTKKKFFWKNEFLIDNSVLIPRPDTEIIIEEVLNFTKFRKKLNLLDIGIGSGCLILSILDERLDFRGVGIDISDNAIKISKENAKRLKIINRIKFFKSDIDNFQIGKYDMVVSNPPYINKIDYNNLDKDVLNHEPRIALYGGLDGTSEIKKVIKKAFDLLKLNGKFFLELGYNQRYMVELILKKNGFYVNKIAKDLSGHDRCIISTKIN